MPDNIVFQIELRSRSASRHRSWTSFGIWSGYFVFGISEFSFDNFNDGWSVLVWIFRRSTGLVCRTDDLSILVLWDEPPGSPRTTSTLSPFVNDTGDWGRVRSRTRGGWPDRIEWIWPRLIPNLSDRSDRNVETVMSFSLLFKFTSQRYKVSESIPVSIYWLLSSFTAVPLASSIISVRLSLSRTFILRFPDEDDGLFEFESDEVEFFWLDCFFWVLTWIGLLILLSDADALRFVEITDVKVLHIRH